MKKRILSLLMSFVMIVSLFPVSALATGDGEQPAQPEQQEVQLLNEDSGDGNGDVAEPGDGEDPAPVADVTNVAKVGNTEYATIDEAIAAWTNNTTLTLLADVTLSDVIKLSSTEYHILDLGTYTMTAASKKDAIQIVNNGRSSASYTLDIKADATNPGGITAAGKTVVVTTGKSGVKDRPIIRFYNGEFNASYIVKHSGSNGTNCPQFQFHGGVFNGTISTNRALNQFYGGTFNGSMFMSVDSSAYTLVAGGTFKNLSNTYGSALNSSKFTIGSAKGVYDREVYVDDNGYYVIAAEEPDEGYEASVAKNPGTNDYLAYSQVSTEGVLNYTDATLALQKNYSTSSKVTINQETFDMAGIDFKGTIVAPAGATLTVYNAPEGLKTEGDVVIYRPAAKIGDTTYETLADAIADANAIEGGATVTLLSDIKLSETIKVKGTVTLDLNGKTITGTDNETKSFALIEIQPGADLTIKDTSDAKTGKITLTSTNNRAWNAYSSVISNQRGKLTVESGTIQHLGGTDMAYAIDNLTNGKGTYAKTVINGGTIKSTYRGVRQFLNGVEAQNILTVNGGTIEGANKSIWMQDPNANANTGALTVGENATLKGDVYLSVTAGSTEWPVTVAINEKALAEGSQVTSGNVPEGYAVQTVNGVIGVVQKNVEVTLNGNTFYCSDIYDALNVVQPRETATIKLLSDFTITADQRMFTHYSVVINAEYITLDLNGKTMTFDYEGSTATCYAAFAIYNQGTLRIIDTSAEKTGTLYNKTTIQGKDGPRILWVTTAGSATLEGGNYISEQGDTMFYCSNSNMEVPTTLYIKDGYYKHTIPTNGETYRYFNIQDGGGKEIIEVSGGTFAHDPTDGEMRFPEGYKAGQNADGTWGVVADEVAQIGKETYSTLAAAVKAAQPGATIKLLKDFKGSGVVIDKKLTIDFGGHEFIINKPVGSTGTESNGLQILAGNTVTLRNGKIRVANSKASEFYILIQNYADLTLNNMQLDGRNLDKWSKTDGDSYVLSNNSGKVTVNSQTKFIVNNDGNKAMAFDVCKFGNYAEPTITVGAAKAIYTDETTLATDYKQYIEAAAVISNTYYATLQQAVNQGGTVSLFRSMEGPGIVINNDVNINFGGFTYTFTEGVGSTGTESNGIQILKGTDVVLRNGTLKVADSAADKFYTLIQNYSDSLSMTYMTLDGTNLDKWSDTDGDSYTLSNNNGEVSIGTGTTIIANDVGALAFAFDACDQSDKGYETLPVVTVHKTAVIKGNIEAAAKIGNVYYATLNAALAAATNNQTVTLMSDISVDGDNVVTTSDNKAVLFKVEGKSITLDMNGKTISVDHQSETDLIYSVVYVEDGASLKVTGNGGIDVDVNDEKYQVAYMFWKRGTTGTLTIENGTYHMDNSADSMVYTNGSEIVTVKGGTWTLDAVGTRVNKFPCIFNAAGSNQRQIFVSGGTYNFDVSNQHWIFEVSIKDDEGNLGVIVNNGDGTWTVTGETAEAAIVKQVSGYDHLTGYATFKDAVAAIGKGAPETTIQLQKDITVKGQFIGHSYAQDVVIDLNDYTMSSSDKALTVYRGGTDVIIKNGTVSGNTTGGTIQVTYGGKLTLGEDVTITSGGQATAIKVDANSTLIIADPTVKVLGGKNDLSVAEGAKVEISAGYFKHPVKAEWCAEGYIPNPEKTSDGYYTVMKAGAAMIGDTAYDSLQAAIEAAQNGETIKVMKNINLANETPVLLDNDYNTYFKVEGKNITIDLNGKTISGEYADTTKWLVGVFSTDNKGHLTLIDNAGGAAVNVTTGAGATVYSLIANYEEDCSITINGGAYTLDDAYDCLVYSGSTAHEGDTSKNEGIIVNGGTFVLKNVGNGPRGNGSPWIFNAKGQNTANIVVEGGSFNADIQHQYYPFEVQMSETLALSKVDGIYTVVDAVAYVNEQEWSSAWYTNNVGYATLEEAYAAVDPVQTKTIGKKTYESAPEGVYILDGTIKDVVIPEDYTGLLFLGSGKLNSVVAENVGNIVVTGVVEINNPYGSAITGKVLNISGTETGNLTAIAGDVNGAFGIGGMDTQAINIENLSIAEVLGGYDRQIGTDTKYYKDAPEGGAAIGSGFDGAEITLKNVHIEKAIGGSKAAGIGARYHIGVSVTIENCDIDYVEGGATAAAIGGSRVSGELTESDVTINISGSDINAVGGVYGAGIGSGYDTHCQSNQPICTINIDDSIINATGGKYAAGVGTGYHNAGLAGEIKNSAVTAVSGEKFYKDTYTQAQDIGFGVVDPAREAADNNSGITVNGTFNRIPAVS